jgi:type IV secretion system protein VirB9
MKKIFASLAALAATACATPSLEIAPDDARAASPAKIVAFDSAAVREFVETPTPWPLPGQLQKLESAAPAPSLKPFERIDRANERAKIEPDADRFLNAVQVYPFMEGALYQLYAAPEQVTDIALEPGERLHSVSAGDTVRWIVGDTASGTTTGERTHILVKPVAPNLKTNLVIATDRRAYHLDMRSFRDTYMAAISWTYPEDALVKRRAENAESASRAAATIAAGLDLGDLKFRYRVEGDRPSWRPIRAFDDGRQVFIQFPDTIAQGEAPPLFITGAGGAPELVNYRMRGNYYVVDRLFAAAELRLGGKKQAIVRITRTDRDGRR